MESSNKDVSQRLNDLNSRIVDLLVPTLVQRQSQGDTEGFERALVESVRYAVIILLLPAAAAGGVARGILTILFGPGFGNAGTALAVLLLIPAALSLIAFGSQALLAFRLPTATSLLEGGRMLSTLALGVVLASMFGTTGMASARDQTGCVLECALLVVMLRRYKVLRTRAFLPRRDIGALFVAYVLGFVTAHAVAHWLPLVAGTAGGCCEQALSCMPGYLPVSAL